MGDMADYIIDQGLMPWDGMGPDPYEETASMAKEYVPEDGPKAPFGLFRNNYKKADSHPDYVGDVTLTDTLLRQVLALRQQSRVASLSVAGWRKETKNGEPYVSCQLQVDTYKTAKRYNVEESEIRATIDGVASKTKREAPAAPVQDDFLGSGGGSQDPFADSPPPAKSAASNVDPFDGADDELPF